MLKDVSTTQYYPPRRQILLAEDNPHDHFLLKEALAAADVAVDIIWLADGDELLSHMRAEPKLTYELVLLDMHLPRHSAEELLVILQEERGLTAPVVVMSSLISDKQKRRLIDLGVHSVFAKPMDLDDYLELARKLDSILNGGRPLPLH